MPSVTVFGPKSDPETVNVLLLFRVAIAASSSSENAPNEPEKPKSCAAFGCASFTIVTCASFLLVNVHDDVSPAIDMERRRAYRCSSRNPRPQHVQTVGQRPARLRDSVTVFAPS